jgi:hypothetical protein
LRRRAQPALPDKRRRPWAQAVPPRSKDEAAVEEAEAGPVQERHGAAQIRLRIKRRILQTMPQPPHSVLADSAADGQW